MLGLGDFENQFLSSIKHAFWKQTYKGMAHNMNGDANFTNGLDKESVIHFDKKMLWVLKMIMIHAS